MIIPPMILANYMMRKAKSKWPELRNRWLVLGCLGFFITADVLFELPWLRGGIYVYPTAIRWLTISHGHYYQFPIYEGLCWGTAWTALACLRYFVNDKGFTVAERGIDEVRATPKQRTWLRVLAVAGIFNVLVFALYSFPLGMITGLYGDNWPKDIANRSYLTDGLCGVGTDRSCAGNIDPIPHGKSAYVNQQGKLVVPAGVTVVP
jgi:hypothetical protein